jgi:hypothetical protein
MKTEIAEKWINALKSGKYSQCENKLKASDGGFCCLGVLTDLYLKEKGEDWEPRLRKVVGIEVTEYEYMGNKLTLAPDVMLWAGMRTDAGEYGPDDIDGENTLYYSLAEMNDGGESFETIAEFISENVETL